MHDDGRVGPPNANGSEPECPTVPVATQKSLVDEAVQNRRNSRIGMCGKCNGNFRPRRLGIGQVPHDTQHPTFEVAERYNPASALSTCAWIT